MRAGEAAYLFLSAVAEYTAAAAAVFPLLALLKRRPPRWVILPACVTAGTLSLALVLVPLAAAGVGHPPFWSGLAALTHLGRDPVEIAASFLANPLGSLFADPPGPASDLRRPPQLWYLHDLLLPFLFVLPFGGAESLFALPEVLKNLPTGYHGLSLAHHHNVMASAALAAGAAAALGRLAARVGAASWVIAGLAGAVLALSLTAPHTVATVRAGLQLARSPRPAALEEAVALIPPDRTVAAPLGTLAHVARRGMIFPMSAFRQYPLEAVATRQAGAVVVDLAQQSAGQQAIYEAARAEPRYRVVFARDGVFLFLLDADPP